MKIQNEATQKYWHEILSAGGRTEIPRWTLNPEIGFDKHEATIDGDLVAALHQLADVLGASFSAVLLAVHARVLAALSGEQGVVAGYVASEGDQPLPCRLMTDSNSWRSLLLNANQVEKELMSHTGFSVDQLRRDLNISEPLFETVFDPNGNNHELTEDTVLWINISQHDEQLVFQTHYRTEEIDAEYAARIAGYHLTALELICADPDADHSRQSLLSPDELHYLIEGLSGPQRELPNYRFHELFEQRAQAHPAKVAAVYKDQQWTYQELNERANKLGRVLLERGLNQEGIVAVVTERNLDWMAAVLAVFKAGGVYLPIEPHFPPERITAMLARAECKLVLTEPASTATLSEALNAMPDVAMHYIDAAYQEDQAVDNLGIEVKPEQLAYIYFTSGSTGEPKGAMCEHGGMLNHLFAKIDDLEIEEGQVVAQVAPQCFDISLWQLVSALLVGGRTHLIPQQVLLDVEQFVDMITDGQVSVLQVVPSYLEVVLSYLDQYHRDLPDLECVSVTGEALTKELTQRWFAAMPAIKLVNAYGLTETSDDTNHEVMDRPPERDRVPLGPAVNNAYIYVVDEHLSPVPLGAPGEIVFSGICVGRGYINDPERTRVAYMDDPIREGERLYRSGDFGRWQPDGKLEFLGRRDAQVKIRGFRIEIGDIENALLRVPDVRHGAVVVAERTDKSKHLVAFYSSPKTIKVDTLQHSLGQSLPAYMVPATFHCQESLPLTANGKINRKKLKALAEELDSMDSDTVAGNYEAPETSTEKRLATAWAKVLSMPVEQIGRNDHFFDKGGTSLSAVRLAIATNRSVSLKDVTQRPILAELAELVDGRAERPSELLQLLSEPDGEPMGTLVCFPYAGGNAVNFQPMASILANNGLDVYAVELPGHDLTTESELFSSLSEVVEQVVDEITRRNLGQILLWGHSSGAALAVETARKLHECRGDVQRIFVGAQLLGNIAERRAHISELAERTNQDIAAWLSADSGYTALSELDEQHAEHVGAAYRHDCVSAHHYFIDVLDSPPTEKLRVPLTVVVANDDPNTFEFQTQYQDWKVLAEQVDLCELAGGGHYFLRTRPADAVHAVLSHAESFTSSFVAI